VNFPRKGVKRGGGGGEQLPAMAHLCNTDDAIFAALDGFSVSVSELEGSGQDHQCGENPYRQHAGSQKQLRKGKHRKRNAMEELSKHCREQQDGNHHHNLS
jgi:hypothetical protein